MSTFLQDIRYGFRQFMKNPGFTIVVVLTLALGIGGNTTIFSMINSVLLESLPYPHPEQLVEIFERTEDGQLNNVSGGAFKDWRKNSTRFAHLAVFEETLLNLTGEGNPERVSGLMVSSEYLSVLGVAPILGRDFAAGEGAVGGDNHVLLLTHSFWKNRFGGDANIIGKIALLDQIPYTVIGVLPPHALLEDDALFLTPDVIDAPGTYWERAAHWRRVIGRLLPGVAPAEAQTELRGIKQQLTAEYPAFKKDWSVSIVSMKEIYLRIGNVRPTLAILLSTVALVLFIACANVSNLLLARGSSQSREMAVRMALGASSWRIVRQMVVESLLFALAGCAVGLLMAMFGVELLTGLVSNALPQILQPKIDSSVLLFTIAIACGCGLFCGIFPALHASQSDVNHDLKESERGSTSVTKRRSQSFLVVTEYALTIVLLIGVGLLLRSFIQILQTNPGFNPKQTLAFDLTFPGTKYPNAEDRLHFINNLNAQIETLPGVESAGAISFLPLSDRGQTEQVCRADQPERTDYVVVCNFVSGDYFSTMGIHLLRGRYLMEADNIPTAPRVFVIDSGIARDLYPKEDPIGKTLRFQGEVWQIVGIVEPVRHTVIDRDAAPMVYFSQARSPIGTSNESMVIRTTLPTRSLAASVRKTVLDADPDQSIDNVRTLEQAVYKSLAKRRNTLNLLGLLALVAISLACIGIYGVTAYSVSRRTHEIGVRIALGAQAGDVIKMVVWQGLRLTLIGAVIGLAGAYAIARLLASQLYGVSPNDPLTFINIPIILCGVALLACYLPARRAAKVDPMIALRCD